MSLKTLVVYYSFTGKTRKIAENMAKEEKADLVEVKEIKKRSMASAFTFGVFAARGYKQVNIEPLDCNFFQYDKIIIAMPIWAGYPAPVINNIINHLPSGKDIELVFTSKAGVSNGSSEQTKSLIMAKGCKVTKYTDIESN